MLVEHLLEYLKKCNPKATVDLEMGLGTAYRINHGDITPTDRNEDLYEVRSVKNDSITGSVILSVESLELQGQNG